MNAEGMRALVEEMCGEYAKVMPYATGYGAMAVADEEWQGQVSGWRARLDALLAEDWHKWPEEKPPRYRPYLVMRCMQPKVAAFVEGERWQVNGEDITEYVWWWQELPPLKQGPPPEQRPSTGSLFGPRPAQCSAPFARCGECNLYPCRMGEPSWPQPPLEDQGETVLDGLTRIGMRHAGEGVRLLAPDDPIYPQEWLDELTSALRVPPEYLRPENTAEQAKRFNREYYGTFPPEPPREGE